MRIKFLSVILSFLLMSVAISSCLDSDTNYEYSSDATIRAFGIDSIGKGIYYKFTIDQLKGEIYNVDSLPVGADTIIDRILIDTLDVIGWVTSGVNDTLFNMNDSVDLRAPIKLKVHAADGTTMREYLIKVNVHKQDPDSLLWEQQPSLPVLPSPDKLKAIVLEDELWIYTSSTTAYRHSLTVSAGFRWDEVHINGLPEDAKLNSIVKFDGQLFVTNDERKAFCSDNGVDWQEIDMQGIQMATFITGIPEDNIIGSPNILAGICTENGRNYFCVKSSDETIWRKSEKEVPADFPSQKIYSTVFTNASGIKQTVIVGNAKKATEKTVAWFTMDGLNWVDMSTPSSLACPAMENPSIMYYGGLFHIMGGKFDIIRSSSDGITWNESPDKFLYPGEKVIIPNEDEEEDGEDEDKEDTIEYINWFKDKGDYTLAIDANHYIWIVWSEDGTVWRGRLNRLGFQKQ